MMLTDRTPEEIAAELSQLVRDLVAAGRNDLLLRSIGVSVLEELRIEAAKSRLSRLLITKDYRIILVDYDNKEVEMTPVHKAVYFARLMDKQTIIESVDMLVNPLNNSINEKCSRIKSIFLNMMDQYTANYYIISGHTQKHFAGSSKIWYERLKNIKIPRELVVREDKQI